MFAALVPPPEALDHLDQFLQVRRGTGDFRWVQPDQVHVTLAFLEHVPEHKLDDSMVSNQHFSHTFRTPHFLWRVVP